MTPIFYQCTVLNNEDPLMLGRVRAKINIDNLPDILKAIVSPNFSEKDIWTVRDPLVFYPLIPYFLYQVPKEGELIQVIFVNPDNMFQNQYYVQSNFFSVDSLFNTSSFGGAKFTGTGMQFKAPKNIKNQNGTWPAKSKLKGIYPEPGDNGLLGRGSADVIVKETDLLIRAGKYKETPQSNTETTPNPNRAFLQLSIFDRSKTGDKIEKEIRTKSITLSVNHLIEWVIINPDNEIINPDGTITNRFTGSIYLYSLKSSTQTNTENISVSTDIPLQNKYLIDTENFTALTMEETIEFINSYIRTCNNQNKSIKGKTLFSDNQNKFPIFFRPAKFNYDSLVFSGPLTPSQEISQKNLLFINSKIKLIPIDEVATSDSQFGLIWKKDSTGLPTQTKIFNLTTPLFKYQPSTYSVLGGEEVYLLSQKSSIDGKQSINFENSIYGFPQSAFTEDIRGNTSSLVRGEELLELINLIFQFLVSHTHAYPGLPPVDVTQSGIELETLEAAMQNAKNKILNSNIRLN